eukprot:SAG11_NODE_11723_length_742_cov_0.883359_1_plen_43_part_01
MGKTVQGWREGEWTSFNTHCEHEAVNISDAQRVVLLLDIVPSE